MSDAYRDTCDACVARKIADEAKAKEAAKPELAASTPTRGWYGVWLRVLVVLGVAGGFVVSGSLELVFGTRFAIVVWMSQGLACCMAGIFRIAPGRDSWFGKLPWWKVALIGAWAPIAVPALASWRLWRWLVTGE